MKKVIAQSNRIAHRPQKTSFVGGHFGRVVKRHKKSRDEKKKTTAHGIPAWSPTAVLTEPSPT